MKNVLIMAIKFSILSCLLVQLCLSCDYINDNGYGYPSGSCYSLDYMPSSFSYTCDSTSSFIYESYETARCSGNDKTIETSINTESFHCDGYNNTSNGCNVVEYENWLYAADCSDDIYVEYKTYVIDTCLPRGEGAVMILCDSETITFKSYTDESCSGSYTESGPYGGSYNIIKCGDQELNYCHKKATDTPSSTTRDTPKPTGKIEKDTDDEDEDDVLFYVLYAFLAVIVLLLIGVIICFWRYWSKKKTENIANDAEGQAEGTKTDTTKKSLIN